jgi:L-ribulokinase
MGAMSGMPNTVYRPHAKDAAVYQRLYQLYVELHDAFGVRGHSAPLSNVMKDLLDIRDSVSQA